MVSDQEIARGVEILLRDPSQTAAVSSVVRQLGAKLGIDLSHKANFIANQIKILRQPAPQLPPQIPLQPQFYANDHFALRDHPQFLAAQLHYQQQQQQQQYFSQHPQFALQFGGIGSRQHEYQVPPQQQHHVSAPLQHVTTPTTVLKSGPVAGKGSKESTQSGTKKRGGSGGLNKLCGVSPELQVIVGAAAMARTEIVRQLWAYIRKNNLQDPSNKRKIICDEALRVVFETDSTDMFKMNKLLAKHILPLDPTKDSVPSKRQKLDVESGSLPAEAVVAAETAKAAETSEGAYPVRISDALALFLGTTRTEMLASEAIQHVCEYVKVNSLEDPSSMTVTCDAKLRDLLGCERISVLEINETLARNHLLQSS